MIEVRQHSANAAEEKPARAAPISRPVLVLPHRARPSLANGDFGDAHGQPEARDALELLSAESLETI